MRIPIAYFVLMAGNLGHVSQRKVLRGTAKLAFALYDNLARALMQKMADFDIKKIS